MSILRLTDGEKRLLLPVPGVWKDERVLLRQSRSLATAQQKDSRESRICGTLCDIGRAMDRDGRAPLLTHPIPAVECALPALVVPDLPINESSVNENSKGGANVFVELMPLLKQRTLLITVARIDEKLKVNVIPAKAKEGEDEALTTPLSYTGSPEELDRELGKHLASYVDSHLALGSTLAEAKAEMDAAAKEARQRARTALQTSKPGSGTGKEESTTLVAAPPDTTP